MNEAYSWNFQKTGIKIDQFFHYQKILEINNRWDDFIEWNKGIEEFLREKIKFWNKNEFNNFPLSKWTNLFASQVLLCFLTGCVIFLMGLLHLGFLVEFVSMPVISGFTNAAAIIIGTSQLGTLLGLSGRSDSFIDAIAKVVNHFDKITFWDPLLGFCSMILLVCLKVRFLFTLKLISWFS